MNVVITDASIVISKVLTKFGAFIFSAKPGGFCGKSAFHVCIVLCLNLRTCQLQNCNKNAVNKYSGWLIQISCLTFENSVKVNRTVPIQIYLYEGNYMATLTSREEIIEYARQYYKKHGTPASRRELQKISRIGENRFSPMFPKGINEINEIIGAPILRKRRATPISQTACKICIICNSLFNTEYKNRLTCSQKCENEYRAKIHIDIPSEINNGNKIYYLYQITNLINNKIYIGVHSTRNINDGYMGSGKMLKSAFEKYGILNFRKDILEYFDDLESMYLREEQVVDETFLERDDVYNLKIGGAGFKNWQSTKSSDYYTKRSDTIKSTGVLAKEKNPNWGTIWMTSTIVRKTKQVNPSDINEYIAQGWIIGVFTYDDVGLVRYRKWNYNKRYMKTIPMVTHPVSAPRQLTLLQIESYKKKSEITATIANDLFKQFLMSDHNSVCSFAKSIGYSQARLAGLWKKYVTEYANNRIHGQSFKIPK